jgi:hypothetical protein
MRKRVKLFFLRLTVFSLQREKGGISAFFQSLWKKRKPKNPVVTKTPTSVLEQKLSKYAHVLPTNPMSSNYNISIEEGFLKPTIGTVYTKDVLLKNMTSNPSQL